MKKKDILLLKFFKLNKKKSIKKIDIRKIKYYLNFIKKIFFRI